MTTQTLRQMRANRPFTHYALSFFLVSSLFAFAADAQNASAQSKAQTKAPSQTAAIAEALRTSFGSTVEAVTVFKPYYLTGDFNGDGAADIVIAVRIKKRRSELPADVSVYNPFGRPKAVFPADPLATPTLALAIIHGAKTGWQTPPVAEKFLLLGESPILILNYSRATSGEPDSVKGLMELLKKSARRPRGAAWPPAAAKGDSIVLGTEATDSILYWNGKNYRWEEAAGEE